MAISPVTIPSPPFSRDRLKSILEYAIAVLDAANTNLAAVNSNLVSLQNGSNVSQLHADLVNVYGSVDGLETLAANTNTKLDSLISAVNAIWTNHVPSDAQIYTAALSLAANPTVLNAPGYVYGYTSSGNLTIRDNTTDKVQCPGGTVMIFPNPVFCATSIKLLAVLASNTSVWFKAA